MNFYLNKDGRQLGPYQAEQIQIFLKQGLATATDLIWADGWPAWMQIANVPGLVPAGSVPVTTTGASFPDVNGVGCSSSDGLNGLCVWMHLSQFTAFITLMVGYILPIVIWQTNKRKHPMVDKQGRIIANWIISSLIYDVIAIFLCFFWIGFIVGPILFLIEIAFPIIGAIKASKGEVWNYPLNINFFKI